MPWLHQNRLQQYADAVHEKGAPLVNCFGFIDGTVRPICRPTRHQKVCYNGHKHIHAIKVQSVSGLMDEFAARQVRDRQGLPFALYGEPAYPLRPYLLCPFRGANITPLPKSNSSTRRCQVFVNALSGSLARFCRILHS